MRAIWLATAFGCGIGAFGHAVAQDHPTWPPSRDVTVTYKLLTTEQQTKPGMPTEMKLIFSSAQQKMRMDFGPQAYMLMDYRSKAAQMVMPQQHMAMNLPTNSPGSQRMFDFTNMQATRLGTEMIAGYSCTDWDVVRDGRTSRACFTADGVMLRANGSNQNGEMGGMEATAVAYAAVPDNMVALPPGFSVMQVPKGMPPGAMGAMPGAAPRP